MATMAADVAAALDQYARTVAHLPCFPAEPWFLRVQETAEGEAMFGRPHAAAADGAVVRLIATNKITGQVLPQANDVWLAMVPFDDLLPKKKAFHVAHKLQRRMLVMELLVRMATSKRFGWHAAMHCGEDIGPPPATPTASEPDPERNALWLKVLCALCPDNAWDTTTDMERNLMALSYERTQPRVMLCVTQDFSRDDSFPELLDTFLSAAGSSDFDDMVRGCGLSPGDLETSSQRLGPIVVELGLRFTKGKFSPAIMTKLLDVIQQTQSNSPCKIHFRVTTLHFGRRCAFNPKALELLSQRRQCGNLPSLRTIRMGSLEGIRAAPLRTSVTNLLLKSPVHKLRRLATCTYGDFVPWASALRYDNRSTVTSSKVEPLELDLVLEMTVEHATWLAFAIFHPDSQSRVTSLFLRMPFSDGDDTSTESKQRTTQLTSAWLQVFRRVLQSVRAEYDLADIELDEQDEQEGSGGTTESRVFVKLQHGTVIKSNPYAGAKTLLKLTADDIDDGQDDFEVIARDVRNHLAVVVPGLGVGWALESAVVSESSVASRVPVSGSKDIDCPLTNQRVTSFTWDRSLAIGHSLIDATPLIELLKIIGRPLKTLNLPRVGFTNDQFAELLKSCPNLQELNVSGHNLTDIQALQDSYLSGKCKIETLSIAWLPSADERRDDESTQPVPRTEMPQQILAILKDQAQVETSHGGGVLRRLAIDLQARPNHKHWQHFIQTEATPFFHAVDKCQRLQFVQVMGDPSQHKPQDFGNAFWSKPFCTGGWNSRHKLALLSCVAVPAAPSGESETARAKLDASVLSLILSFCVDLVARRVVTCTPLAMELCECACDVCTRTLVQPGEDRTSDELARAVW